MEYKRLIGTDGEIIIWHLKKKRIIKKLQSPFSKNKKFPTPSIQALATFNNILIAASKGIEVWDITNFKLIEVLEPYDTSITSVVFTNNDRNLAFKVNNKIIFWDLKKNKFAKEIILDNKIHSITSTSDGKISGITKESKKCSIYTLYPKKDLKVFEHSNILYSIAIDYNNDILIAGSLGRSQFLSFLQKNKNSINNWKIHDYWLMVGKYRFEERDFS